MGRIFPKCEHCVHKIINMEFSGKINDTGYKFLSPTSACSLLSILNPMTLPTTPCVEWAATRRGGSINGHGSINDKDRTFIVTIDCCCRYWVTAVRLPISSVAFLSLTTLQFRSALNSRALLRHRVAHNKYSRQQTRHNNEHVCTTIKHNNEHLNTSNSQQWTAAFLTRCTWLITHLVITT